MNISKINTVNQVNKPVQTKENKPVQENKEQGVQQFSSKTSNAYLAYGLSKVSFGGVQKVENSDKEANQGTKTINLFYFSDTHGELTGLTKLGSAKEACEEFCGGKDKLTVLGSGDLIAGSQTKVIKATVDVVNKMGMEASAMGNHERGRSNAKLQQLADDLAPEILAINPTDKDKGCSILPSKVCKQGDMEFITVGAQPLTPIQDPKDIATAIDAEVARIKEDRKAQGLNDNLPVVFLSHMGSSADKTVAENSETVNLILGGHTHNVEEFNYTSKNGQNVLVLQAGANNAYATVVKMDIAPDGVVTSTAKKIDIKQDVNGICSQIGEFYAKPDLAEEALAAANKAGEETAEIVSQNVGPKVDVAYVPEGQGYINDGLERNYSNPVSNIMADAMLAAAADKGGQVSFFNAPSLKDTSIPDMQNLSNYDIMGRMLPFGGEIVVADLPIDKFYEIIEQRAQTITGGESQLAQCGGMTYSVDAEKAIARYNASIDIMQAEDDLKNAQKAGGNTEKEEAALAKAQEAYDALPGCVEKILILNNDRTELKINPKAIARGDYEGQTLKCVMNDFLAHETGVDANPEYNCERTGKELTTIFEDEIGRIKAQNEEALYVDHNDVRIALNDEKGLITGYGLDTSIHSKYWY